MTEMTLDLALKGTNEESFVKLVKLELQDIKRTFVKIGFRLKEANEFRYYEKLGYSSIEELAENEFELKRTSTYNLIAIAKHFCNGMFLSDNYKNFSYSQLIVMVKMLTYLSEPYKRCNENFTVMQFNEYYHYLKKGGTNGMSSYFQEQQLLEAEKQINNQIEKPANTSNQITEKKEEITQEEMTLKKELINHLSIFKMIFDPDNKGIGVRVLPSTLADEIIDIFNNYTNKTEEQSKCLDKDKIYELYSEMENGCTGLYRAYNQKDIERAIKNYSRKKINFIVKEYEFVKEKIYKNKGEKQ